jgi:hypothetical protein
MNNVAIIEGLRILHGINEELKTYGEWLRNGRQVVKGARAVVSAPLWKRVEYKDKETGALRSRFVLTTGHLFTYSQTEKSNRARE